MTTTPVAQPIRTTITGDRGVTGAQNQALNALIDGTCAPHTRLGLAEVSMPGTHRSLPHVHEHTPMIVCILDGHATTHHGASMTPLHHGPGQMVYVPPGLEHAASNRSSHQLSGLEARLLAPGDEFNYDTTPLPELKSALDTAAYFAEVSSMPVQDSQAVLVEPAQQAAPGLTPVVHRGTVAGAKFSCAQLHLLPTTAEGDDWLVGAHVHEHEQRIIAILSGTATVICGNHDRPDSITLNRNDVLWVPEHLPYSVVNLGRRPVTGLVFATDPDWDRDRAPVPELDRAVDELVVSRLRHDARRSGLPR